MPTDAAVRAALQTVTKYLTSTSFTPKMIFTLYGAEKAIGRHIQGISPLHGDTTIPWHVLEHTFIRDSALMLRCVAYVRDHLSRFREVSDGWKGEENFWEPNDYWLTKMSELFPSAPERNTIAFDLDFKAFIRQFDIDDEAAGKSCETYINELLIIGRDSYKEAFSDEEINGWIPECIKNREKFEEGRAKLLEQYGRAPFTRRLEEIDATTIVVYHSVC